MHNKATFYSDTNDNDGFDNKFISVHTVDSDNN